LQALYFHLGTKASPSVAAFTITLNRAPAAFVNTTDTGEATTGDGDCRRLAARQNANHPAHLLIVLT
jgi:hypothetical protein